MSYANYRSFMPCGLLEEFVFVITSFCLCIKKIALQRFISRVEPFISLHVFNTWIHTVHESQEINERRPETDKHTTLEKQKNLTVMP